MAGIIISIVLIFIVVIGGFMLIAFTTHSDNRRARDDNRRRRSETRMGILFAILGILMAIVIIIMRLTK